MDNRQTLKYKNKDEILLTYEVVKFQDGDFIEYTILNNQNDRCLVLIDEAAQAFAELFNR